MRTHIRSFQQHNQHHKHNTTHIEFQRVRDDDACIYGKVIKLGLEFCLVSLGIIIIFFVLERNKRGYSNYRKKTLLKQYKHSSPTYARLCDARSTRIFAMHEQNPTTSVCIHEENKQLCNIICSQAVALIETHTPRQKRRLRMQLPYTCGAMVKELRVGMPMCFAKSRKINSFCKNILTLSDFKVKHASNDPAKMEICELLLFI